MDAELLALQKLFAAAQEAKSTARLSERNVVELVTKLQQLKLLDTDLLYTLSGKEYLTQQQLKKEVEGEVERLGRVSLVDLAATLGVDLYHVEKQAELVVASNPDLALTQGEVLSSSFWDNLAEDVNETLQEAGHIPLVDLAKRFSVGAELLSSALEPRLGKLINGKLEGGQLFTPAFVSRVRAMVRGSVRALTVPTPLSTIWACVQQELREGDRSVGGALGEGGLFHSLLNSLVDAGEILGTLRGGGASWTPLVFSKSQRDSIGTFFSQNGYIGYDVLRKLAVPQPKPYLQTIFPEGVALNSVFVHPTFINVIDAAAEEAVNGGGWFDALPLVPSSFGTSDAAKLLSVCPSVQRAQKEGSAEVMADTCVVSSLFIKGLLEKFEAEVRKTAHLRPAAAQPLAEAAENGSSRHDMDREDVQNEKSSRQSRGKATHSASKSKVAADSKVEEGGKAARGRKKGKAKGGPVKKEDGELGVLDNSVPSRSTLEEEAAIPSAEQIAGKLVEWYPDMETAGADDGDSGYLSSALASWLRPKLVSSWLAIKRAIFTARADERRRSLDSLQQKIGEAYASLQLYSKAIELFEDDKTISVVLQRHLLRTVASEIADMFLTTQVLENKLDRGEAAQLSEFSQPLNTSQRLSMAKTLSSSSLSRAATSMAEALEGKDVDAFDASLEEVMRESGLRLKKMDKKGERALLHSYSKVLQQQVEDETDPVALLPKVVGLLFIQVHNKALQAPGRAIAAAIIRLEKSIPENSFCAIQEYHGDVVRYLSMIPSNDDPDTLEQLEVERTVLRTKMDNVKALVVSSSGKSASSSSRA